MANKRKEKKQQERKKRWKEVDGGETKNKKKMYNCEKSKIKETII